MRAAFSTYHRRGQWNDVAKYAKSNGFGSIRITGFDCDALERASSAAAANGVTVMAGIYITVSLGHPTFLLYLVLINLQGTVASSTTSVKCVNVNTCHRLSW